MPNEELKPIDDYEVFLTETMTTWSPQQRVALAASIAERWLPAYESFSAAEEWGDPASLRRSLDAVWGHVQGRTLAEPDVARHLHQVEEITPHMDGFDAAEALTACVILKDTLRSCTAPERAIPHAMQAALSAFEELVQDWPEDLASQQRVWRKRAVRKELQAQLKLVQEIDTVTSFDAETIKALRGRLAGLKLKAPESDLMGQVPALAEMAHGSYLFAPALRCGGCGWKGGEWGNRIGTDGNTSGPGRATGRRAGRRMTVARRKDGFIPRGNWARTCTDGYLGINRRPVPSLESRGWWRILADSCQ